MGRVAAGIGALVATMVAAAPAQALPELTISMPSAPYPGQYAPVYVDAFQEPGKVLYRFDALIHNEGTTLDLYRDPLTGATGRVRQVLWPAGLPTAAQRPDERPPADVPRAATGAGATIEYVVEETHAHFHFFTAARYELEVPGAAPRVSGKIGFCMFDSFDIPGGTAAWFRPEEPWCHEPGGDPGFVRMGLSPGAADRYSSQREFQYVDVTGLAPGAYRLRGIANPEGHVLEDDEAPDVTEESRTIPGVVADPAAVTTAAGTPVGIDVRARAVAPEIPARRWPPAARAPPSTAATSASRPTRRSPTRSPPDRSAAPPRSTGRG